MHCVQATRKIHLYIDNRLSLHEMRALETHLASCTRCRQELLFLEEVSNALTDFAPVMEPMDLTANIMQRVAQDVESRKQFVSQKHMSGQKAHHNLLLFAQQSYTLFRLSLQELLAALLLASITTLGIILTLPSLRSLLPFTGGNDPVSHTILYIIHVLAGVNSGTLTWAFWILGTLIGICITLALAGNEVRRSWLKAMTDRLPVW